MHHLEHPQIIGGMVRHGRDLDNVGIHRGESLVQEREVGRGLLEVMVANDPLRHPVAANAGSDVILEVYIIGPFDDGRPQQGQPRLFGMLPAAAVALPPAGHDDGAGAVPEEPLHLHLALEIVEPQLDEPDAVLHQMLVFGDHVPMPATADAHADHRFSFMTQVRRNCRSRSCLESVSDVGRPCGQ